jgi:hypothetical protein
MHLHRGAKLVFDGVELPSIHGISSRKTRSGGDKDAKGTDDNMEIKNGSNNGTIKSFYIPSGSHNNVTRTPTERNATRGHGIAKQRKGVSAPSCVLESEQPFACESSFSRGMSPLAQHTIG